MSKIKLLDYALKGLGILLAYVAAGFLGLELARIHHEVSPVWPASAVGLVSIVFFGRKYFFVVFLAAFLVNVINSGRVDASALIALGNATEALIGGYLFQVIEKSAIKFEWVKEIVLFLTISLIPPIIAALNGTLMVVIFNNLPPQIFWSIAFTWWTGDALGILVLVPFLYYLIREFRATRRWKTRVILELALSFLICSAASFTISYLIPRDNFEFGLIILVLISGSVFSTLTTYTASVGISIGVILGTILKMNDQGAETNTELLQMAIFVASVNIVAIVTNNLLTTKKMTRIVIGYILGIIGISIIYWVLAYTANLYYRYDTELAAKATLDQFKKVVLEETILEKNKLQGELKGRQKSSFAGSENLTVGFTSATGSTDSRLGQDRFFTKEHGTTTIFAPKSYGFNVLEATNVSKVLGPAERNDRDFILDRILVHKGKGYLGIVSNIDEPNYDELSIATFLPIREIIQKVYALTGNNIIVTGLSVNGKSLGLEELLSQVNQMKPADTIDSELTLFDSSITLTCAQGNALTLKRVNLPILIASIILLVLTIFIALLYRATVSNQEISQMFIDRSRALEIQNKHLNEEIDKRIAAESEQKDALLKAERANRAKTEFLASMSHEIRTPLNSVIGFAEMLSRSELSGEQASWATFIQLSGKNLLALINDILDLSKIESGQIELETIDFSPILLIEELLGIMKVRTRTKGLELVYTKKNYLPKLLCGDPLRTKQIITNLISNAIKFTDKGKVELVTDWTPEPDKGGTLKVCVKDTGIGISEEGIAKLFKNFSQADSSTTRKYGGSGLGLSISKKLAEKMDGSVTVESKLGEGSTFTAIMKFKEVEADTNPTTRVLESLDATEPVADLKILVVEDVALNQILMRGLLEQQNHRVTIASNGVEALEKTSTDSFDIIFMDCQMPELDGYQTTKAIRIFEAQDTADRRTPIIALTANALDGDQQKCLEAGMDDYLSKPISFNALSTMIAKWSAK